LLKRFRQSVLAAATSGRLTEDWRKDRAGNFVWRDVQVDEVADVIDPHPSHRTPASVPDGVPYISIGDVDETGVINFGGARRVGRDVLIEHQARYTLSKGDFIFGKIGIIGRPTKIPINLELTISANVLLVKANEYAVIGSYLILVFDSPEFLANIIERSAATSQAAFGIKKMRETRIRIPMLDEQLEIVRRVESLFAFADRLEARLTQARSAADRLTPALLAKAFRGELVPQDPDDEPAAELLKRLAAGTLQNSAKRTRRASTTGAAASPATAVPTPRP
jgi:type I restriction enzyme S subunit